MGGERPALIVKGLESDGLPMLIATKRRLHPHTLGYTFLKQFLTYRVQNLFLETNYLNYEIPKK